MPFWHAFGAAEGVRAAENINVKPLEDRGCMTPSCRPELERGTGGHRDYGLLGEQVFNALGDTLAVITVTDSAL